ncbi:MAG TPA: hypothetical protein PKE27_08110 [Povalibacter sp.]|uniref:hypothetical protein n=1 Tax=Povalibacter sp. TaxID=1962978 RepID=UPI002BFEDDAC|nr:hypothetical protein [Povalibacter sp.]HMN44520.1 hypothetical protein [Povalibacter sp.]
MSKKQEILALVVAPLFPAVIAALLIGLRRNEFDSDTATAVALGCTAGGYIAGFCIAWPLLGIWRRLGWTGPAAGAVLGVVSATCLTFVLTAALIRFSRGDVSLFRGFLNLLAFTAPMGAVGGLAFWWFGMQSSSNALQGVTCETQAREK